MKKFFMLMLIFSLTISTTFANIISLENIQQKTSKTFEHNSLGQQLAQEIDKPAVAKEVEKLGIDSEEAKKRLLALSDREIQELASQKDQAGGAVVVISLTTILLIVIIVLLLD